jgi:hypothetical protein
MDFRVYYHGAEGVLNESRPVFGKLTAAWDGTLHFTATPGFFSSSRSPFTLLPLSWAPQCGHF